MERKLKHQQQTQRLPYYKLFCTVQKQIEVKGQNTKILDLFPQSIENSKSQRSAFKEIWSSQSAFKIFDRNYQTKSIFEDDHKQREYADFQRMQQDQKFMQRLFKMLKKNSKLPHNLTINTLVLTIYKNSIIWPGKIVSIQSQKKQKYQKNLYEIQFINRRCSSHVKKYNLAKFTVQNVQVIKKFITNKKLLKALKIAEKLQQQNQNKCKKSNNIFYDGKVESISHHFSQKYEGFKDQKIQRKLAGMNKIKSKITKTIILQKEEKHTISFVQDSQKQDKKEQKKNVKQNQIYKIDVKRQQCFQVLSEKPVSLQIYKQKDDSYNYQPINLIIQTPKIPAEYFRLNKSGSNESSAQLLDKSTSEYNKNDKLTSGISDQTFFQQDEEFDSYSSSRIKYQDMKQTKEKDNDDYLRSKSKVQLKKGRRKQIKLQYSQLKPIVKSQKNVTTLQRINKYLKYLSYRLKFEPKVKALKQVENVLAFFDSPFSDFIEKDSIIYSKSVDHLIQIIEKIRTGEFQINKGDIQKLEGRLYSVYGRLIKYDGSDKFVEGVKQNSIESLRFFFQKNTNKNKSDKQSEQNIPQLVKKFDSIQVSHLK